MAARFGRHLEQLERMKTNLAKLMAERRKIKLLRVNLRIAEANLRFRQQVINYLRTKLRRAGGEWNLNDLIAADKLARQAQARILWVSPYSQAWWIRKPFPEAVRMAQVPLPAGVTLAQVERAISRLRRTSRSNENTENL